MTSCFSTTLIGAFRSLLFHSVICSLGGPLSAVGLRRSTSNVNYLFYHWTSFDCIRSFINKQLNTFHFKQLLIHTEFSTVWVSTFCLKLNKANYKDEGRTFKILLVVTFGDANRILKSWLRHRLYLGGSVRLQIRLLKYSKCHKIGEQLYKNKNAFERITHSDRKTQRRQEWLYRDNCG